PAADCRRRIRRAGPEGDARDRPAAGDRGRRGRGRVGDLCRPPRPRDAEILLQRRRPVRAGAVVRAVWHHAGRGDGVRHARRRSQRRRHQVHGTRWRDWLPGAAEGPRLAGGAAAHLYQHPKVTGLLSRQAIRRANDLFTWQKVASSVAAVYEEVLAAGQTEYRDDREATVAIERGFDEAVEVLQEARRRRRPFLLEPAETVSACLSGGGKVLTCGSGASAADAQRLAA